ncbi:hypothetical protein [Christiangramia sp. LLG6405-1]|uniref:hypothetical protein n=1 Tax=Christiangramia sp. LLG6405-1 TaxID=3160832 RepID=UPI003870EB15
MNISQLNKYSRKGKFQYRANQNLREVCTAPPNYAGIYLIYEQLEKDEKLIYIGSSGQRDKNGNLKVRKGGLYDRIINGYHPNRFGKEKRIKRNKAFPLYMQSSGISQINIYWFVTYDDEYSDFPTDVEKILTENYITEFGRKPEWHK